MAANAAQIAEKWARNLGNATESIKQGVNAVAVAPTEKAAQAQDRYLAGVQRSVADGKYADGLRRVSLDDWKRSMLEKGLNRVASGASAARPKMAQFMADFMPYVEQGVSSLPERGDMETNIQRAIQMMRHNANFRRRS